MNEWGPVEGAEPLAGKQPARGSDVVHRIGTDAGTAPRHDPDRGGPGGGDREPDGQTNAPVQPDRGIGLFPEELAMRQR